MSSLPPFQVPLAIATSFPELLMLDASAKSTIETIVQQSSGFSAFLQTIQRQGPPAPTSGWALTRTIPAAAGSERADPPKPVYERLDLSDATCLALAPFLAPVLNAAMNAPSLQNLVWTQQDGTVPGPQANGSSIPDWTLTSLSPRNGVVFSAIHCRANGGRFELVLQNMIPRHLGVYVEFLQNGQVFAPADWSSMLPQGVASGYESATLKYLGMLTPNTAVAGIDVAASTQSFGISMPTGADAIRVVFGGIGYGAWQSTADVAGVMLSFVCDYAVPLILNNAKILAPAAQSWFQGVLTSQTLLVPILNAGQDFLIQANYPDVSSVLQGLSDTIAAMFLGDALKDLRASINQTFGANTVENALPYLGWPAQTLKALFDNQQSPGGGVAAQTTSRLLSVPPGFGLALSSSTLADLVVQVNPDATWQQWPVLADHMKVDIDYGAGFSQTQTVSMPQTNLAQPVSLTFGSLPDAAPVAIAASCYSADGQLLASGQLQATIAANQRLSTLGFSLRNAPVAITSTTQYLHKYKLSYGAGQFNWLASPAPSAVKTDLNAQSSLLLVIDITLQEACSSLGYTWRATDTGITPCGGGSMLSAPYFFQNIGSIVPQQGLITLNCGFALQSGLVYSNFANATNQGYYLDPRNNVFALRPVTLGRSGSFDLAGQTALAKFDENSLSGLALLPQGDAAAISWANSKLEIVKLAAQPVADTSAPSAQLFCGVGTRAGLLASPVGSAVTPEGFILVLEDGNQRIQAFDSAANPVALFSGSPVLPLHDATDSHYLDIAVAPEGVIYVLAYTGNGSRPADYRLETYQPDGSFIGKTIGVNGARLAAGAQGRVYTLNYEAITGPGNRVQPSISLWIAQN